MPRSRRDVLRAGAFGVPLLVCTVVASTAMAAASVRGDDEISLEEQRAMCPVCLPGHPCPRHLA